MSHKNLNLTHQFCHFDGIFKIGEGIDMQSNLKMQTGFQS